MNMKWFWNPCRRNRANICLLASGTLAEDEMSEVQAHLAECADCRKYHDEMKSLAKPLADWERNFAHVKPTQDAEARWAKAIQAAADVNGRKQPVRELTFAAALANAVRLAFLELIWPCRRFWTGLAAVWILILAANVSLNEHSPAMAKSGPSSEMIMTLKDQQTILAELLTDRSAPRDVERQKTFLPKPHTETVKLLTA